MKALVCHGANINYINEISGNTALYKAMLVLCKECVGILLDTHCDVGIYNNGGFLAIHYLFVSIVRHDWDRREEILKITAAAASLAGECLDKGSSHTLASNNISWESSSQSTESQL